MPSDTHRYTAVISWERNNAPFTDNRYSRAHQWTFDGGIEIAASASPQAVPPPSSLAEAVDPEEAFVAALSSCHMLWFLSIAASRGFVVESYRDEAIGIMQKNAAGKLAITEVTLRPRIVFSPDKRPSPAQHESMHHEAHEECFIANSVRTDVRCASVDATE
jgi:organic hydroperoxide reductase OsmC/OhrA